MKKYISIILGIGILIIGILVFNVYKVEEEVTKHFSESGYILQAQARDSTNQTVERYYFEENGKYKQKYNEKVIFEDTNGENITSNIDNYIHYSNGSISSFKNGVILNLADIEENPIYYYNFKAGNILKKQNNVYSITNLDKELKFENLIWKISGQKYIVLGSNIELTFDDGTNKQINGYLELEYSDNEIVKIYNQEITYKTISTQVLISFPDNIVLNVSKKTISKDNDTKMSLENMVIDSDENVTIIDLTEESKQNSENDKNDEKEDQESTENNQNINNGNINNNTNDNTNNNTNNNINNNTNNNTNTSINDQNNNMNSGENINNDDTGNTGTGNTGTGNSDSEITGDENEDLENETTDTDSEPIKKEPKYKVEEFNVSPLGVNASIIIEDVDNLITENTTVKILKNKTGKTVYETEVENGDYNINIEVLTLDSDTEYTLIANSTYEIDGITYNKDFVSKIFRTSKLGITLKKEVFTDKSMEFAVNIEKNSGIKSLEIVLQDENGENKQIKSIENINEETKKIVEFENLESNTKYYVSIANVLYNSQIITNGFEIQDEHKTLKAKPILNGCEFEINKRDGKFILKIRNIQDTDKVIEKYQFRVYDVRTVGTDEEGNSDFNNIEPVRTLDTQNTEVSLNIDNESIFRNVGYIFKVVAIGNDNEKKCEYESEYSNVFKMDGEEFPTVRFEETNITFERIQGKLIVEDEGETIHLTDDTIFKVTYKDSTGNIKSFSSQGSYVIPVDVNNLRANETYQFAVYATVDLNDGNPPIDECFIGGVIVKTDVPKNMVANFTNDNVDVKSAFKVRMQLENEHNNQGTLEAETLTGIVFSIYSGQAVDGELPSSTPLRVIKMIDTNIEPYESELKQNYYDNAVEITPEFFGAQNKDFKNKFYTITVTNAYDYTDYQNSLPILNNIYTIQTNGFMPDLPTDTENAVSVQTIRNSDKEDARSDLNGETVVGYEVKATYNNSDLYAKQVIYSVYDANTNQIIKTITKDVGSDGVIPSAIFDVNDGTDSEIKDIDEVRRGNSYYFIYEIMLDLNGDGIAETVYPYDNEDVVLRSKEQTPMKQEPIFITYPVTSNENTIQFKYKCSDVDNAIVNSNNFQIKLDKIVISQQEIKKNTDEYELLEINGLNKGDLQVNILQKIQKSSSIQEKLLIEQEFEGINKGYSNLTYQVELDANRVMVKLFDNDSGELSRVAAIKIKFSEVDGTKVVEKDLQSIPDTNIIGINLNELGTLLNSETLVEVFVYYDTGVVGYELESDQYVTYQAAGKSTQSFRRYYTINENGKFVETTTIRKNIYSSSRVDNEMAIKNLITDKNIKLQLDYSESGFKYQGNVLLQKQLDLQQIQNDGNNIIRFDLIIPGISVEEIQTELTSATLKANLIVNPSTDIVDNAIYMEIFETDENGIKQKLIRTEKKDVSDFSLKIQIDELEPKKYYFLKFRTKIKSSSGMTLDNELYDIDYQVSGKQYYFSTLANVGIKNILAEYVPVSYNEKYISLTYNLEKITGYSRIEYKLYHYNISTKQYELFKTLEPDVILQKDMEKKIEINPGSGFIFGDRYEIEIIPIAEYYSSEDGQIRTLELGKEKKEFIFEILKSPIIAIRGSRNIDNSISYKITIYDESKVIKNDKYRIQIFDGKNNDITPQENQIEYDTNIKNNNIKLDNVEKSMNYTLIVSVDVDIDNSGEKIQEQQKKYTVHAVNEYGISIGNVSTAKNSLKSNKIDLVFNDSYKLTDIETVKYSIYNTNGYAENIEENFIPTQYELQDTGEVYYTYELTPELSAYGKYIIEIQFIKDGDIIETQSLEYIYRQ